MGAIARFLLALNRLARARGFKIEDAYKFAKQEFGEITPLLRKQIQNVFDKIKKPVVGKPGKKEGAVIPMVKEGAKKAEPEGLGKFIDEKGDFTQKSKDIFDEGIKGLEKSEGIETLDPKMGDIENLPNPKRPGGPLDPAIGITRALARRILDRKGIEIGKKDPIDVFSDTFGEAISDVNNLAEEMIEIDARGGGMKDMDQMLEIEGLFDIEIPTNPNKGLTDDELLDLMQKTEEEEILKDFDPKGRKPSATGGRAGYENGDIVKPSASMMMDTTTFNPIPKDAARQKINSIAKYIAQASLDDEGGKEALELMQPLLNEVQENFGNSREDIMRMLREELLSFMKPKKATGGRVQAASGGLVGILKL